MALRSRVAVVPVDQEWGLLKRRLSSLPVGSYLIIDGVGICTGAGLLSTSLCPLGCNRGS